MSNDLHKSILKFSPLENYESEDSFIQKEEDLLSDFIFEKIATNDSSSIPLKYLGYNTFRILTSIIFSIILISLIVLIILFYITNSFKSLLCFSFEENGTHFLTNSYSFLICLIVIIFNIISIINFLIKNNKTKILPFLNEMSFGLPLALIFFLIRLLLGSFITIQSTQYFVHLCLSVPSIGLISILYIRKKRKKYIRAVSIINESFFLSLLLGLYCYEVLYLTYKLIPLNPINHMDSYVGIGFNIAFFCIGLGLLTLFKDIIFTLFIGIIEMGLLVQSSYNSAYETITSICILLFLFSSSVILIFKYKTKVFGYVEKENLNCVANDTDKMRISI